MDISIWQLMILLVLLPMAFLPTIIALKKDHPYKIPIILINIFGGLFYGLGWLVALVWCFIVSNKKTTAPVNVSGEIEQLHKLLEKCVLTQEEFDTKKRALLNL